MLVNNDHLSDLPYCVSKSGTRQGNLSHPALRSLMCSTAKDEEK